MKAKLQWLKNGADVEEGQNVYLWENIDKSYEYVPKDGAVGLEAHIIKDQVLLKVYMEIMEMAEKQAQEDKVLQL